MTRSFRSQQRGRARTPRFRLLDVLLAVAVLAGLAVAVDRLTAHDDVTGRARVTDGDSLVIDGRRIRLQGIDAPELDQTCTQDRQSFACGHRAREALAGFVEDRPVSCRSAGTDRYGRMLGVCMVDNNDIAEQMVRLGWAIAYGGYHLDELAARRDSIGLWAGTFDTPQDWRRANDGLTEEFHVGGLVSALRERWYRLKAWATGGGTS
jgi:endonuclease YncB( thermonuclease family)